MLLKEEVLGILDACNENVLHFYTMRIVLSHPTGLLNVSQGVQVGVKYTLNYPSLAPSLFYL